MAFQKYATLPRFRCGATSGLHRTGLTLRVHAKIGSNTVFGRNGDYRVPGMVVWPSTTLQKWPHLTKGQVEVLALRLLPQQIYELVFHTTSGASRSGPASTYLNIVTVVTCHYQLSVGIQIPWAPVKSRVHAPSRSTCHAPTDPENPD
jgi:hypothetical protein